MKCDECVAEGERSTLTSLGGMTTLLGWHPYYDEDGNYHAHDPNETKSLYRCSRGHQFTKVTTPPCPSCSPDPS
jgi:hypothetical protein